MAVPVLSSYLVSILQGSGYGYGTVPGGRWAIDTEGGHVVVSVSLIRNGYEYGRRSRGRFRIPPPAIADLPSLPEFPGVSRNGA